MEPGTGLFNRRERSVRYADITHCASARWGYAMGTTRALVFLRQSQFESAEAFGQLDRELKKRVAAQPGGEAQLAGIARIDQRAKLRSRHWAIYGFLFLCVLAQFLQLNDPAIDRLGSLMPPLVSQGEVWRILISNFLHDTSLFPLHLALNAICIFSFGILVERSLGSAQTVVVMAISGVAAMWAASMAGHTEVIGGSGVAAGLVGATLCLEFNANRFLPVWSRIPRRLFIGALVAQGMVDIVIPFVAGAAHAGGFVAGYLVTRRMVDPERGLRLSGPGTRRLAALAVLLLAISVFSMLPLVARDPEAMERHGIRVLQMQEAWPGLDNETAWRMLTESQPREAGVEVAVLLALRAAQGSFWRDPNVLDTLAESLFAAGDIPGAAQVIEEAIFLSRGHRYFMEQRDRFLGFRDPEDRPEPPEEGWWRQSSPGSEEPGSESEPSLPIEPAAPGESAWI
ncbi:MAG: rhomboid family intramembrane serine protease [Myxococcota bacterium]|nr:rhomboid family intramembrane serine protease [Myxococcota bacterium]